MLIFMLLTFIMGGLATALVSSYDAIALAVFPVLCVSGLILIAAGRPPEEKRALTRLFMLSFLLRVAVAIAIYRFGLVDVLGDEDSSGWFGGWGIAQAWRGDPAFVGVNPSLLQALGRANHGYGYLAAIFLYLIGAPSRLSLAMLSALAGALTVGFVYRIGSCMFGRNVAEKAGTWAAVFPSLVIWSAQTLKEPFVILFECAIVYAVLALRSRVSLKLIGLLLASLFCLYTMRFYAAYLSVVAAMLALAWPAGVRRANAALAGALVFSAVIVAMFASGLWHLEQQRLGQFNLAWVQSFRTNVATGEGGGSGILLPYDVTTPGGVLAAFPLSLISFLLSPYPWQALGGTMRLKLSLVDVALWWWMIPHVLAGIRKAWRTQRESIGLQMLFIGPLTVFYALTFGNAGLAFRQRAQVLVLLLVFAGLGLSLKKLRRSAGSQAAY
jgi:hypothetical protein